MTYPSMRDENGVKPPPGSLEYEVRFARVYGMGGDELGRLTGADPIPARYLTAEEERTMDVEIEGLEGSTADVGVTHKEVSLTVDNPIDGGAASWYTPTQARELAAALLRAADEADEIADDPSILAEIQAEAERVVREVRDEVARDLEAMDGTNLGMSLSRSQAVNVARRGLRQCDVQHGTGVTHPGRTLP